MSRAPRQHLDGGLYHVTLRGNYRAPIFFRDADRGLLQLLIAQALERYKCRLHAYCFMTNHIHLAVQVSERPLGLCVGYFATLYAKQVHRRHETSGHLFERRHHAVLVDSERHLLALVRYIHLNPVRAGLVARPSDYFWSSHRSYLGMRMDAWLTTDLVLGTLASNVEAARLAYRKYLIVPPGEEELALLRRGTRGRNPVPVTGFELEDLITRTAAEFGVTASDLASPSKIRVLSKARAQVARRAGQSGIASLPVVARRLNRSPSSLSELLQRHGIRRIR